MKLCLSNTQEITDLAKKMNLPESVVNNLVGIWYRENGDEKFPTEDDILSIKRDLIKKDIEADLHAKGLDYTKVEFKNEVDNVLGRYMIDILNKIGITTVSVSNDEMAALAMKRIKSSSSEQSVFIEDINNDVIPDWDKIAKFNTQIEYTFIKEDGSQIVAHCFPDSIGRYAAIRLNEELRKLDPNYTLQSASLIPTSVTDYFSKINNETKRLYNIDINKTDISGTEKGDEIRKVLKRTLSTAYDSYVNSLIAQGYDKNVYAQQLISIYKNIDVKSKNTISTVYAEVISDAIKGKRKSLGTNKEIVSAGTETIENEYKILGYERDGKIYYNENVINANTMAHEYTHMWWDAVRILEPELYKRGIELLRQTYLYNEIKNDPAYKNISNNEHKLCSEVLSRLSGKRADEYMKKIYDENGKSRKNLGQRIKDFIREMWSNLIKTFSNISKKQADALTLDDISKMPVRDLMTGVNPFADMSVNATNKYFEQVSTYQSKFSFQQRKLMEKFFAENFSKYLNDIIHYAKMDVSDKINKIKEAKKTRQLTKRDLNYMKKLWALQNKLNIRNSEAIEAIRYIGTKMAVNIIYNKMIQNKSDRDIDTIKLIFSDKQTPSIVAVEASNIIRRTHNIRLSFDTVSTNLDDDYTIDDDQSDYEDELDESYGNNTDVFTYGGKIREEDPFKGTGKIRQYMSGITNVDKDGNPRYVDGVLDTIPFEYAYAITLSEFAKNVIYPEDFAVRKGEAGPDGSYTGDYDLVLFKKLANKFPFFNAIINRIENDNDKSILSEMYHNLRKDWIHYYGSGGKNGTIFLNESEAKQSAIFSFINNYQADICLVKGFKVYDNNGLISIDYSEMNEEQKDKLPKKLKEQIEKLGTNVFLQNMFDKNISNIKDIYDNKNKDSFEYYMFVLKALGLDYDTNEIKNKLNNNEISVKDFIDVIDLINNIIGYLNSNSEKNKGHNILDKEVIGSIGRIAEKINIVVSNEYKTSFPYGGKTRQSYVAPNYADTMVRALSSQKLGNAIKYAGLGKSGKLSFEELGENSAVIRNSTAYKYMQKEFMPYEWFYKNGQFVPLWLRTMFGVVEGVNSANFSSGADSFYLCDEIGTTDYLFHRRENKAGKIEDVEYKDWTKDDVDIVHLNNYFDGCTNMLSDNANHVDSAKRTASYVYPIFSSSPCCKTIKGIRIPLVGKNNDRKQQVEIIIKEVANIIDQELGRIRLVQDREKNGDRKISNFDKNGKKFMFFPSLNKKNVGGKLFIDKYIELNSSETPDQEAIDKLLHDAAAEILIDEFNKDFEGYSDELFFEFFCSINNRDEWKFNTIDKFNGRTALYLNDIKEILNYDEYKRIEKKFNSGAELSDKEMLLFGETSGMINLIKDKCKPFLEDFSYNNTIAQANIIQMTVSDIAFYKDDNGIDFQKRYKEVYASGLKLFTESKYGKKNERVLVLSDSIITSTSYTLLKDSLENRVKAKEMNELEKDFILSNFRKINSTDAQAFRTFESYRSVLDMMGKWDDNMARSFDNITKGKFTINDFNTVFQTLKPFFYGQIPTKCNDGRLIKTPIQHKNSEAVMLSEFANAVSMVLSKNPQLRALERYMNKKGIDVAMFESAVKCGKIDALNISYSQRYIDEWKENNKGTFDKYKNYKENNKYKNDFDIIKNGLDIDLNKGEITQNQYNDAIKALSYGNRENENDIINNYLDIIDKSVRHDDGKGNSVFNDNIVYEVPYDNYMIAQQTPEDLFDAKTIFGSQFRQLIIGALPDDFTMDYNGAKLNKDQTINFYRCLISENILESFIKVRDKINDIRQIREMLLQNISDNGKYSNNLKYALDIIKVTDPITGEQKEVFRLPINDPSLCDDFQKVILSVFKNKITKQTIKGGHAILMSDFGLTDKLKPYKENGKLIFPIYLPVHDERIIEKYQKKDDDGNDYIDIKEIESECPEIIEGIGYRIPTEGKYSMINFKIAGFLPRSMGSAVMLPAEIVTLAGSDFDVDKMFLMMKDFTFKRYDVEKAYKDYMSDTEDVKDFNEIEDSEENDDSLSGSDHDNDNEFKEWFRKNKANYKYDKKDMPIVANSFKSSDSSYEGLMSAISSKTQKGKYINDKKSRDNAILDICINILRDPKIANQVIHPGNYDDVKSAGSLIDVLKLFSNVYEKVDDDNFITVFDKFCEKFKLNKNDNDIYDKIYKMLYDNKNSNEIFNSIKKFTDEFEDVLNPLSIRTFEHFHAQDMIGNELIGVFANNNTNINKTSTHKLYIDEKISFKFTYINKSGKKDTYNIFALDDKYDVNGNLQIHNTAQLSAAAVDNEKDPRLKKISMNKTSATMANYMLRAKMPIPTMSLFLSRPVCQQFFKENLSDTDFTNYLKGYKADEEYAIDDVESMRQIAENVEDDKNTVYVLYKIYRGANALKTFTMNTKQDSPNGAIDSQIHKAEAQLIKMEKMNDPFTKKDLIGMNSHIKTGGLRFDATEEEIREYIQKTGKMDSSDPMGQAFYSCGVELPYQMMRRFFVNPIVKGLKREIHDLWKNGIMPDDMSWRYDRDLMYYLLTKTTLFGDENVDYASNLPVVSLTQNDIFNDKTNYVYLSEYKGDDITINNKHYRYSAPGFGKYVGKFRYEEQADLNTYMRKRNYYLYRFPTELQYMIKESRRNKDSVINRYKDFFGRIILVDVDHKNSPTKEIVMNFGNKPTEIQRDEVEAALEEMISSKNKEDFYLAKDLFMYCFYSNGLKTGLSRFFTPRFRAKFREYTNFLNDINDVLSRESMSTMRDFNLMFLINNPEAAPLTVVDMKDIKSKMINFQEEGDNIVIRDAGNKHFKYPEYQRIKKGKDTKLYMISDYKVDEKGNVYSATYRPIVDGRKLYIDTSYPMYNAKSPDINKMLDKDMFFNEYGNFKASASFAANRPSFMMPDIMPDVMFMAQKEEINDEYLYSQYNNDYADEYEDEEDNDLYVSSEIKKMLNLNKKQNDKFLISDEDLKKTNDSLENPLC